jgi:hypothetical protein
VLARYAEERYADLGPTLMAEHLAPEGLVVDHESLRDGRVQVVYRGRALKWRALPGRPARVNAVAGPGKTRVAAPPPPNHPWRRFGAGVGQTHGRQVQAQSCVVLAVRARAGHPQLLSTSRHVTQGLVDVTAEAWDESASELSGTSRLVGGDACELRLSPRSTRGFWKSAAAQVSAADRAAGVTVETREADGWVRVTLQSPQSRKVHWRARFTAPGP